MFNSDKPIYEFRGPWGVPVQIGSSIIFLFLIFISFSGSPRAMMFDVIFVLILVGSIYLHELGHAWGCYIQGIPVRRVVLHGAGGFCERTRSASRYQQELIVAMGPIVNLVLWALGTLIVDGLYAVSPDMREVIWVFETIARINLYLAIFNLMPLQPLDGGKLFELILARFMRPEYATKITGIVGMVMIVLWLPLMIFSYFSYGLILMFIPAIGLNWSMAKRRLPARTERRK